MSGCVRLAIVGAGLKAVEYAQSWLRMSGISIVAVADTSAAARDRFADLCREAGETSPDLFEDVHSLLASCQDRIDAVYLSTPHAFHAEGALAVIDEGLDLLLEKPMVTTQGEAQSLISACSKTNATVVIAYQGGLSPLVSDLGSRASRGEFGELISISGNIWENWSKQYGGQWKQVPEISGGGFMFDTGAHMMNTVCTLANNDFARVSAFMNNRSKAVDIVTAVAARLSNGALVTLNAVGDTPSKCESHITLYFTEATIRVDAWGQWREIVRPDGSVDRKEEEIVDNPLLTFLAIRDGKMPNLSPVENGMRLAKLWDAIKASAAEDGVPVSISAS
ncbi:Gfo/Idh/MocA family oxidoreductase [Roseibium sp. SCPC15]|uniref:Gfo/Idh/MocA family protein n=1 Tax=Roseibium sp. SCP15 TaxID=3141376 RepID=UPI00333AD260